MTDLAQKMLDLADSHSVDRDHDLVVKAKELEAATIGCLEKGTHTTKQLLGAWARARRAWCDYTGEPWI